MGSALLQYIRDNSEVYNIYDSPHVQSYAGNFDCFATYSEDNEYIIIDVSGVFPNQVMRKSDNNVFSRASISNGSRDIFNHITASSSNTASVAHSEAKMELLFEGVSIDSSVGNFSFTIKIPKDYLEFNDYIWLDAVCLSQYGEFPTSYYLRSGVRFKIYGGGVYDTNPRKIRLTEPSFFNRPPTLSLALPSINSTLYENDTFKIDGTTADADVGDVATVKYQINNSAIRTLSTAVSNGASIPFNKNLTFKNKRLYDGATVVSDELNGGTSQTLKVWTEDDKGAKSAEQTRTFNVVPNRPPTLVLSTGANQTLYERDPLLIYGSTKDVDNGDTVTVKFQIDSSTVRNLHSAISDGSTSIPFSKQLTYSDGVLKDGTVPLTSVLDEGSPHTLSVWSEDGNGGKSTVQTRTFHVVPNRPPTLSVNPIATKSNLINSETLNISGTVGDLDNNDVVVTFSINDGETRNLYQGRPGSWTFNIMLKDLDVGKNRVVIKAIDSYQAEVVKVLTINKIHDAVPVNHAVALYKINPPAGSAQKMLLWIERQLGDLAVTAEVSMTNEGEPENFVSLPRTNSEMKGVLQEDEFAYDAGVIKTNIIVKIIYNRTDSSAMETIKRISGVLS